MDEADATEEPEYDVVVVGGGIAGLAAAHSLAGERSVLLLEAADVVGGKLRVSSFADVNVDEGAEQVLVRTPEALDLMRAAGLAADIVYPLTSAASVWSRGALRPLPGGTVLGVPAAPAVLARSGVLTPAGLLRAAGDLVLPRTPIDSDIAVGRYVRARVGRDVVDRLVDPLLGGVYAGRADELSLAATVPQLMSHVRRHRTLLAAARAARPEPVAGPVFAGLVGGLGRLPVALADVVRAAGVDVRTRTTVRALAVRGTDGFRLTIGPVPTATYVNARAVVVAVPAAPAARLLANVAPAAAADVGGIDSASVAVVSLAYRQPGTALRGSGFLVPAVERRTIKAVTYLSAKWQHLAGDLTLLRASVGRYGEQQDLQRDDDDIVAVVHAELADLLGMTGPPEAARVTRWGGGLPQYAPGHLDRVRRVRAALPPGVVVCGAAYDGVGVPACIRSGQQAASGLRDEARMGS